MSNKTTTSAGLTFNVNTIKNKTKEYYESQNLQVPVFGGGQIATTAMLERLLELLIKECCKHTPKDKAGTKQVTRPTLQYSVSLNPALNEYYKGKMEKFDKDQMYSDQLPILRKEIDVVINRVDKDIVMTPKGMNTLSYLLFKSYVDIVSTAYEFITFSGKRTLDSKVVNFAIKNRFADGLTHELTTAVNNAMKLSGDDEVENVVDAEDNAPVDTHIAAELSADEDDQPAEEAATDDKSAKKGGKKAKEPLVETPKSAKGAKSAKTAKKATTTAQIEQDETDEVVEGEELENELDTAPEEVDAKPTKSAKSAKGAKTAAPAKTATPPAKSAKTAPKGK